MTPSEEEVELACTTFQKRVQTILKKDLVSRYHHSTNDDNDDLPEHIIIAKKAAIRYIQHANHILRTLSNKLRSMENAMRAFREVSSTEYIQAFSKSFSTVSQSSSSQEQERILHQWFTNYLRLRDGFVLFESGEARHKHDIDDSKNKFSSKLHTKPKHSDGTRTYSSKMGYTGYGLDEFNDDDVGVRNKLLDQIIVIRGGRGNRDAIWNSIMNKCEIWDTYLDQVNAVQGNLRKEFTRITSKFVTDVNQCLQSHRRGGKLTLVGEGKAERISFGSLDVCREGNKFTLSDKGGSLPVGMSVLDWTKKFSLPPSPQQQQQQKANQSVNKNRKRILESSDEDSDEDNDVVEVKKMKASTNATTTTSADPVNDHGLVIRKRVGTTTTAAANTSSLDEIKRQSGVSATQLEQGFDQLEEEEFKSTMAANEDDVNEGFLAENNFANSKRPHLMSAVHQIPLLRRNVEYQDRYGHVGSDAENLWNEFHELVTEEWKDAWEVLTKVNRDISSGKLKESSNEAYVERENVREVNMLIGLKCMEIDEFLSEEMRKIMKTAKTSVVANSLSPFLALLSETIHCFLLAAEEASKNALLLVLENENHQKGLPDSIRRRHEKGQHFLLRGRAQYNIGQALFEQSQCQFVRNRAEKRRLLRKASKEFEDSLNSANLCRGNSTAIYGHADAGLVDSDSGSTTWTSKAMRQSFDALQHSSMTRRLYGKCLWELGETEKAENMFSKTADFSDYVNYMGDAQISSDEVVDALCDLYYCALELKEVATTSLERILSSSGSNEKKGNEFIRLIKLAFRRARSVSDKIFSLAREHSIQGLNGRIHTRETIDLEEKRICDMWEKKKSQPQQNILVALSSSLPNADIAALPRRDVVGLGHHSNNRMTVDASRKRYNLASDSRRKRIKHHRRQKEDDRQTASDNFNDAFGDEQNNADSDEGRLANESSQQSSNHPTHIKWGNELLEEHERNAYPSSCPPLPPNIPLNLKLAITAKLADILPKDDSLVAKLYT